MKFLKILEKKGHRQKEEEPEDDIEKEVVPSLLMAHALAEALCENKQRTQKLAAALSFAKSPEEE